MLNELILFDSQKPHPTIMSVLIWTAVILVVSQVFFLVVARLIGIKDLTTKLDNEKEKEYKKWKHRDINPYLLLFGDIVNSCIYAPLVEEGIFRVLLMKFILVGRLSINADVANIIQAIIFGGLHMTNIAFSSQTRNYTYLQTLSATISGIVSGWVYIRSNNIFPCLLAHIANNLGASISEWRGYMDYRRKNVDEIK